MAELRVEGDELVLALSALEKAESIHGDIRVPVSSVRDVEVVDDEGAKTRIGAPS